MPAAPLIIVAAVETGAAAAIGSAIVGSAVSAGVATAVGVGVVSGGITAAQGGDASDILQSAVIGGVTAGIGSEIASGVSQSLVDAGVNSAAASVAGSATAGALKAGVTGGDPLTGGLTAGLTSGINQGIDYLAKEDLLSDFDEWSRQQAETAEANFPASDDQTVLALSPDIPTPVSSLPTSEAGPGYYNEVTGEYVPSDIGGLSSPLTAASGTNLDATEGYQYDPTTSQWTLPTGEVVDMGYLANSQTPYDPTQALQTEEVPGVDAPSKSGLSKLAKNLITPQIVSSLMGTPGLTFAGNREKALGYAFGDCSSIPWLDTKAQMLAGKAPAGQEVPPPTGGLSGFSGAKPDLNTVPPVSLAVAPANMTPELLSAFQDRGIGLNMASGGEVPGYASGSSAFSCTSWGPMSEYAPKFYPVKCNMLTMPSVKRNPLALAGLKQLHNQIAPRGNIGMMAKGGLPEKYKEAAPDGHDPEFITGVTGYYAGGRGTGQSDDIPAMLHDGDYVIDAEAVSALGDGSSKAGNEVLMSFMKQVPHRMAVGGNPVPAKIADGEVVLPESFVTALGGGDNKRGARMLDQMRQHLREHKRSAPNSRIPPKAKTPMEYLRGVKG